MKKDKPLKSPSYLLNSSLMVLIEAMSLLLIDKNILWKNLKERNGAKHLDICDFTTATSVLSLARKADLSKASYCFVGMKCANAGCLLAVSSSHWGPHCQPDTLYMQE